MKKILFPLLLVGLLASCSDEIKSSDYYRKSSLPLPTAITGGVVHNFGTAAAVEVEFKHEGLDGVREQGLLIDTLPLTDLTKARLVEVDPATQGKVLIRQLNLKEGKTYYYRAFCSNKDGGIALGEIQSFVAKNSGVQLATVASYAFDATDPPADVIKAYKIAGIDVIKEDFSPLLRTPNPLYAVGMTNIDFSQNKISGATDHLLSYKVEVPSSIAFPSFSCNLINLAPLVGIENSALQVTVYLTESLVDSKEKADKAPVLGQYLFGPDAIQARPSYMLPESVVGKTIYITLRVKADGKKSLGALVRNLAITAYKLGS